jgi:predicted dienelactone hydrolase
MLFCATLCLYEFGCSSSSPAPVTVTITPTSATAVPGQGLPFSATTSNNSNVNWSVSCSTAPCGSVSPTSTSSGGVTTYTPPPNALADSLAITITAAASASASAQATVTLPAFQASVWSDSSQINPGTTTNLYAQAVSGPSSAGFTWKLDCSPAPCGTLSTTTTQSGTATVYTAPSPAPLAGLTVNYTATSTDNSSISASGSIQVLGVTVSLDVTSANVIAAGTQQFVATVTNDPTNSGVTWSASCSPAPCGTVPSGPTPSGTPITYTAPPTPPPSDLSVTVTATAVAYNGAIATASITVPAITVSVSPGSALMPLNSTLQFSATVANDPAAAGVTWSPMQSGTSCSPACGSVSASNPTTYTAPGTMPPIASVAVTATSVSDTTKSAAATINLSTGTVQLVPQSVTFGRQLIHQASLPRSFVLTNKGTAALTITGFTFTGANASDFSQSNTCGTSIDAGGSCTISVMFKPGATGNRFATVAIADSSTDSPQQAGLSGIGFTRRALDVTGVNASLAGSTIAVAPLPTGPETVGTRVVHWVDPSRRDPFAGHGESRELLVRFWYPASLQQACEPADYTSPRTWSYFSHLLGIPLPAVRTNSCLNAPVATGRHPVVVFTHGYTGTFTDYTFLFEDLASRGFIVASVNHTYEATATEFPDGRFVTSRLGSHLNDTWRGDEKTLVFASSVRLQDLRFVLNQLQRMNTRTGDAFAHKLELSRIAVAGHSAGGTIALRAIEQDSRFKAAVVLDGFALSSEMRPTKKAVFLMRSGSETDVVDRCELWSSLHGPRVFVNLNGAEHLTPSDALWLARGAIATGPMGTDGMLAAIRDEVATFLDTYLRGGPIRPESTSPSSADANAVTRGDPSCSQH